MELASSLLDIAKTALTFLIVITVLVAVHELGHFWFARLFGMEVKAFAVMMGGIRKTDLRPYLKSDISPSWVVWVAAAMALGLFLAGVAMGSSSFEVVGLGILAVAIPIWVTWRLQHLYHLPGQSGLRTLATSFVGGLLLLMFATKGQGINMSLLLGVLMASGFVGVLLVYYKPVLSKSEDSEMGEGRLEMEIKLGDGEASALGLPDSATRVESVPVMFRPLAAVTDKHGTEFSFLALPLGGFAAIKGMHPKEDGSEIHIEKGFYSRPAWQRLIVLFAGPFFSVAFGVLLLAGLFVTAGAPSDKASNKIDEVVAGKPAAVAGIRPGDTVVEVNGEPVRDFVDMVFAVRGRVTPVDKEVEGKVVSVLEGAPTVFVVQRGSERISMTIKPEVSDPGKPLLGKDGKPTGKTGAQAQVGIKPEPIYEQKSVVEAFGEASMAPVRMVTALGSLLSRPQTASEAVGGPISMAEASSSAASKGLYSIILLAASLSISLGIMNLLPIPPLDGGQMVVAFVEMLRREKRLSIGLQQLMSTIGVFLVIALTLTAFVVDLGRQANRNQTNEKPGVSSKQP